MHHFDYSFYEILNTKHSIMYVESVNWKLVNAVAKIMNPSYKLNVNPSMKVKRSPLVLFVVIIVIFL